MSVGRPFVKGQSGNPGGRAKGIERLLRERFGDDVPALVAVLVDLGLGRSVEGYDDAKASDRIRAGAEALDRIVGKAPQSLEVDANLGASAEQLALLAALQMTPEDRRRKMAEIDAEDAAALALRPVDADPDA